VEPLDIVKRAYERYAARDLPGVFELLADDVVVWQSSDLPWGGEFSGHDGALAFFSTLSRYTTATPQPLAFVPAGKHVAVYGRLRGRAKSSENEFDIEVVHLWQVEDGKINRFEAFIDIPAMLSVLTA
jgi:uncharacterized protein